MSIVSCFSDKVWNFGLVIGFFMFRNKLKIELNSVLGIVNRGIMKNNFECP